MMTKELLQGRYTDVFYHYDKKYLHAWIRAEALPIDEAKLEEELNELVTHFDTYKPSSFILNIKDYKLTISQNIKKCIQTSFPKLGLNKDFQKFAIVFGDNLHNALTFEDAVGSRKDRSYAMASFTSENEAISWGLAQKNLAY